MGHVPKPSNLPYLVSREWTYMIYNRWTMAFSYTYRSLWVGCTMLVSLQRSKTIGSGIIVAAASLKLNACQMYMELIYEHFDRMNAIYIAFPTTLIMMLTMGHNINNTSTLIYWRCCYGHTLHNIGDLRNK